MVAVIVVAVDRERVAPVADCVENQDVPQRKKLLAQDAEQTRREDLTALVHAQVGDRLLKYSQDCEVADRMLADRMLTDRV